MISPLILCLILGDMVDSLGDSPQASVAISMTLTSGQTLALEAVDLGMGLYAVYTHGVVTGPGGYVSRTRYLAFSDGPPLTLVLGPTHIEAQNNLVRTALK